MPSAASDKILLSYLVLLTPATTNEMRVLAEVDSDLFVLVYCHEKQQLTRFRSFDRSHLVIENLEGVKELQYAGFTLERGEFGDAETIVHRRSSQTEVRFHFHSGGHGACEARDLGGASARLTPLKWSILA
ncbi:MAG: hypothetical protein WCG80_05655 [Spirochaetales bacterium]